MSPRPFLCHIDPQTQPNFARCEISSGDKNKATLMQSFTTEEILAKCVLRSKQSGPLITWSDRAANTLAACLPLRQRLDEKLEETFELIRAHPSMQDRKRHLSKKKLDLCCVHVCRRATTEPERKENSRFSNLVRLAYAEQVSPDQASEWLKTKTLSEVLRQTRASKPSTTFPINLPHKDFPLLAAAFKKGAKSPGCAELRAILERAARECERLLESERGGAEQQAGGQPS